MKSPVVNCLVRNHQLMLSFPDKGNCFINIDGDKNTPDELEAISKGNRLFSIILFTGNRHEEDGCLPSKCLDIAGPSVNISPRYLINCFINTVECVFSSDNDYNNNNNDSNSLFVRDKDTVELPMSSDKMESLIPEMFDKCRIPKEEQTMMEVDCDEDTCDDNSDDTDLYLFINTIIEQLYKMQGNISSYLSKSYNNSKSLQKKASVVGGFGSNIFTNIFEDIDKHNNNGDSVLKNGMKDCAQTIHKAMRRHRMELRRLVEDENDQEMKSVKTLIRLVKKKDNESAGKSLYVNDEISLKLMFDCIGEINNALFLNIIPKTSMMTAMQAVFYHAAVLREMKILEKFSHLIQMPILYRLIYCCFKDDSNSNSYVIAEYNKYMRENYKGVFSQINKLRDNKDRNNSDDNFDTNVEIICSIASKSNIQDEKYKESLYWLLNEKRWYTFEYYLVLMAVIYMQSKCGNVNNFNKISNAKTFITPVYEVLILFYRHVNDLGLETSLRPSTIESFSDLYRKELRGAVGKFTTIFAGIP